MWDSLIEASPFAAVMVVSIVVMGKWVLPQFVAVQERHTDRLEMHTEKLGVVATELAKHNTISKSVSEQIHEDIRDIKRMASHHTSQMDRLITVQEVVAEALSLPKELIDSQQKLIAALTKSIDEARG